MIIYISVMQSKKLKNGMSSLLTLTEYVNACLLCKGINSKLPLYMLLHEKGRRSKEQLLKDYHFCWLYDSIECHIHLEDMISFYCSRLNYINFSISKILELFCDTHIVKKILYTTAQENKVYYSIPKIINTYSTKLLIYIS